MEAGFLLMTGESGLLDDPRIRERLHGSSCLVQGKVQLQFEAEEHVPGSSSEDILKVVVYL
jgi:hypothetical protein